MGKTKRQSRSLRAAQVERVYDGRKIDDTEFCYCNYPNEINPNLLLDDDFPPENHGKKCPCILRNRRLKKKLDKMQREAARRGNVTQNQENSEVVENVPPATPSFAPNSLPVGINGNTAYGVSNCMGHDGGDDMDYGGYDMDSSSDDGETPESQSRSQKKSLIAHEAWSEIREHLRNLFFRAMKDGPRSPIETCISGRTMFSERCTDACFWKEETIRVFFQHAHVLQTFTYCSQHSSLIEAMMINQIMPASPRKPKSGIAFALLKEIRNFSLIGKIAVSDWARYLNDSNRAPKNASAFKDDHHVQTANANILF
ncbi:hypothetical protein MBANPS3_011879 [Mucor bainieri]